MIEIPLSQEFIKATNLEKVLEGKRQRKKMVRKRGRPRKRKGRPPRAKNFRNIPLGRFLYKNCPLEWRLITENIKLDYFWHRAEFIEGVCLSSDNPIFKTSAFRKALGDFRRYGMHTPNKQDYTIDDEIEMIKKRVGIRQ